MHERRPKPQALPVGNACQADRQKGRSEAGKARTGVAEEGGLLEVDAGAAAHRGPVHLVPPAHGQLQGPARHLMIGRSSSSSGGGGGGGPISSCPSCSSQPLLAVAGPPIAAALLLLLLLLLVGRCGILHHQVHPRLGVEQPLHGEMHVLQPMPPHVQGGQEHRHGPHRRRPRRRALRVPAPVVVIVLLAPTLCCMELPISGREKRKKPLLPACLPTTIVVPPCPPPSPLPAARSAAWKTTSTSLRFRASRTCQPASQGFFSE